MDVRLAELIALGSLDELVDLGCDLSDQGLHRDAERCFRSAAQLGSANAQYNLGNELLAQERWLEAAAELRKALDEGVTAAALNLGHALSSLGDADGAEEAYRAGAALGDAGAMLAVAFLVSDSGQTSAALELANAAADAGYDLARSVAACWKWGATLDPNLEQDLRVAADDWGPARAALGDLLRGTGRPDEAREVLEFGAGLGQFECWVPLGNLLVDVFEDREGARHAYVEGIRAGDNHAHHNLGVLLESLGDEPGARREYQLGAEGGDQLAARALAELGGDGGS